MHTAGHRRAKAPRQGLSLRRAARLLWRPGAGGNADAVVAGERGITSGAGGSEGPRSRVGTGPPPTRPSCNLNNVCVRVHCMTSQTRRSSAQWTSVSVLHTHIMFFVVDDRNFSPDVFFYYYYCYKTRNVSSPLQGIIEHHLLQPQCCRADI